MGTNVQSIPREVVEEGWKGEKTRKVVTVKKLGGLLEDKYEVTRIPEKKNRDELLVIKPPDKEDTTIFRDPENNEIFETWSCLHVWPKPEHEDSLKEKIRELHGGGPGWKNLGSLATVVTRTYGPGHPKYELSLPNGIKFRAIDVYFFQMHCKELKGKLTKLLHWRPHCVRMKIQEAMDKGLVLRFPKNIFGYKGGKNFKEEIRGICLHDKVRFLEHEGGLLLDPAGRIPGSDIALEEYKKERDLKIIERRKAKRT